MRLAENAPADSLKTKKINYIFFVKSGQEPNLLLKSQIHDLCTDSSLKMSSVECPPTPPNLPEGDAAVTPPPKSPPKSEVDGSMAAKNVQDSTPNEDISKVRRPSSPDEPSCAICLAKKLENTSYTDACAHKFCFVCLLEWSKVKAECPLCKTKFKSIIHNIKSKDDYDSYTLPPRPPRPPMPDAAVVIDHEENRRFRYRTTMVPGAQHQQLEEILQGERRELAQLRAMAEQMFRWRSQLPTLLPSTRPDHHVLPNRTSAGILKQRTFFSSFLNFFFSLNYKALLGTADVVQPPVNFVVISTAVTSTSILTVSVT